MTEDCDIGLANGCGEKCMLFITYTKVVSLLYIYFRASIWSYINIYLVFFFVWRMMSCPQLFACVGESFCHFHMYATEPVKNGVILIVYVLRVIEKRNTAAGF